MDAAVMKQAIFDNVIDWENSTLPAKDTLTVDNFTMEYFGSHTLAGDIDDGVKQWAPSRWYRNTSDLCTDGSRRAEDPHYL